MISIVGKGIVAPASAGNLGAVKVSIFVGIITTKPLVRFVIVSLDHFDGEQFAIGAEARRQGQDLVRSKTGH